MGRIGESIARTWQVAAHMKAERGSLPEDVGSGNDNARVQALHGQADDQPGADLRDRCHEIGSLEPGKLADIVLWEPKFFGIKPEVVFKGGFPAWSVMGESNASLMTCEPLIYRPQWGAYRPGVPGPRGHVHGSGARSTPMPAGRWSLRKRSSRRAARVA